MEGILFVSLDLVARLNAYTFLNGITLIFSSRSLSLLENAILANEVNAKEQLHDVLPLFATMKHGISGKIQVFTGASKYKTPGLRA